MDEILGELVADIGELDTARGRPAVVGMVADVEEMVADRGRAATVGLWAGDGLISELVIVVGCWAV